MVKILLSGQQYELRTKINNEPVLVQFIGRDELGNLVDGITNEEVVNMMIERFYELDKRNACAENKVVIMLLKNIRSVLRKREIRKFEDHANKHKDNKRKS